MSVGMRRGWGLVVLAWAVGTCAEAGSISGFGGMLTANLLTSLPSWQNSSPDTSGPDASITAPPVPRSSPPPAAILPAPDAYSYSAPVTAPSAPAVPVSIHRPVTPPATAPIVAPVTPPAPAPIIAPVTPAAPAPAPIVAPAPPATPVTTTPTPGGPVYILPPSFYAGVSLPTAPTPAAAATPPAHRTAPEAFTSAPATANAFINLGTGPYPEASLITSGNSQPWYNSPQIAGFFGGHQPDAVNKPSSTATVLQRVQQAFQNSGVAVSLTSDPSVSAPHTMSLVSNTFSPILPTAIGMTDIGANGFQLHRPGGEVGQVSRPARMDRRAQHRHELMLAFGVNEKYDATGQFIDARNATLSMMLDPSSRFSDAAAAALNQALASANLTPAAQDLEAQTVPEPGTLAVWGLGMLAVAFRLSPKVKARKAA